MKAIKFFGFFGLLTILLLSPACDKQTTHDTIPNVAVDIYIDVNSTLYVQLSTVGGWLNLYGGYKGVMVYRVSAEEFVAYDRACPYDPYEPTSQLEMDLGNLTVVDTVCKSKFVILDGSVLEGPATVPMRRYNTAFDGNILRIYN